MNDCKGLWRCRVCAAGISVLLAVSAALGGQECEFDEQCEDGDICTINFCDPDGFCDLIPLPCEDDDACTADFCDPDVGCMNPPLNCDDNDACTTDSCDPVQGCMNPPINCDDDDLCTLDDCDPAVGCLNDPVDCEDGDLCTINSCDPANGDCLSDPVVCDDADLCTEDSCDSLVGCVFIPLDCDDGDLCTIDDCDPAVGCLSAPVDCEDGDLCTVDTCDAATGECINDPLDCKDADLCTDDSCDPATGDCINEPFDCSDGDPCTIDSCDPATGSCLNEPIICEDDDPCTTDSCVDGACEFVLEPPAECSTDADCPEGFACIDCQCFAAGGGGPSLIIKQGACPAPVNPESNGVVPMLLVGDTGFDVREVITESLELRRCDGVGGFTTPIDGPPGPKILVLDLNHPFTEAIDCFDGPCACNPDQSSDGIDDLWIKFRTNTFMEELELSVGDGVVVLELSGIMQDGSTFAVRDCVMIVPPGSEPVNMAVTSNEHDVFIEAPLDLNIDTDGWTPFGRTYIQGTVVNLSAPMAFQGKLFEHWVINNVEQPLGARHIEVVADQHTTLRAIYHQCAGDVNYDYVIDPSDLAQILSHWGPCDNCKGDLSGNGFVGMTDLAICLGAWGECADTDP